MSNKKTQFGQRKSLLTGASVLAAATAALASTPALAQEQDQEEEAIVVTGTRLVRQDFEAISPVTTVGSEQLELTATLTTDSLLNELPQIVPGNTRTSNNAGGEDFATVDLRGLGPTRTLVLVNGERVPASSTTGVVDINTIPASLISRIEVVTGGASAVYGSDAVAGVINFVLKDDYEGGEINMTYGSEMETGNAQEFEINGLVGGNFANGRGNMTTYASYYNREGVLQSEYDYSRVSAAACVEGPVNTTTAFTKRSFVCDNVQEAIANGWSVNPFLVGGSGTPAWGWITNSGAGIGADFLWGTPDDTGNPFGGAAIAGAVGDDGVLGPTPAGPDGILGDNPATPDVDEGADDGTSDDTPIFAGLGLGGLPQTAAHFAAGNTDTNCDGIAGGNVRGGNLSFDDAGNLTPRNTAGFCGIPQRSAGSSRYNFAPDNFIILPAERIALSTSGHYDITDDVRLNMLINYTNSRTQVQLAPTPVTGLTVTLTPTMRTLISTDHPDLWAALQSRPNPYAPFTMDRRTNEIGTRNGYNENSSFYFMTSLEGSLGENWDWNLGASYGQSNFTSRLTHSANKSAFLQGLAGCHSLQPGPDGNLQTADDEDGALPGVRANCVPIDIFGPGTLDDAMVSFLDTQTFQQTIVEENRVTGYVRGDLFSVPAGPVSAVFGFEYRDDQLEFHVDNEQKQGNIFGFNALQDQQGSVDVYELYTEFALPLISEQAFAHYLGLEAGYRVSNYSSVGNVETYKIGGEWAPAEWLRFRAVYNQATRAPNVFELFQAGDQGFPAYIDPCNDGAGHNAACLAAGGTAAIIPGAYPGFAQNNSQVQAFAFGNPNLSTETAQTETYGVVFQPDWFPVGDLRATVDYYHIEVTDVIATVGAQFFLNDCYINGNVAGGCARIVRNGDTGQVFSVNTSRSNQASLETSGIDFQAEWSVPIGPGQLSINELYSKLDSFQFNGTEFAGTTSAAIGGAFPDYKSVLSISYNWGDWTLFTRWTYTPAMVDGLTASGFTVDDTPDASYVDVSARWNVTDSFTLTANVSNVMDDLPPQTPSGLFSQANTDPQTYRVLGRQFAISGRYRF